MFDPKEQAHGLQSRRRRVDSDLSLHNSLNIIKVHDGLRGLLGNRERDPDPVVHGETGVLPAAHAVGEFEFIRVSASF